MKIAFLQSPFISLNLQVCGGIERTELAEISELTLRGNDVTLYVPKLIGQHRQIQDIKTWNPHHPVLMWKYYLDFWKKTKDCAILHSHYAPPLLLIAPTRSILHLHGLSISWLPYYKYFKERYKRAHFILVAEHVKESYLKIYPELPESHLHILYNAADIKLFYPSANLIERKRIVIGYHSLWEEPKGIFDLLKAAEILKCRRIDFDIALAGSPFFEGEADAKAMAIDKKVREMASKLGNVRIVGSLTHPELAEHLRGIDIGVLPSNHPDPFPLAVLEIMASGLPVVAYDIGGAKEAIINGETGFLVENRNIEKFADALETLIMKRDLRIGMGIKARKRVEEYYTWQKHTDRLLQIYEKVTNGC